MSEKLKHTIFTSTDCISEQTMYAYIDGTLSLREQHVVEKHLLDCELCSDAMDGLHLVKNRSRINAINKAVERRAAENERKIISINFKVILSIAAGLLLLMGGVFFFNYFVTDKLAGGKDVAVLKTQEPKRTDEAAPAPDNDSGKTASNVESKKTEIEQLGNKNKTLKHAEKTASQKLAEPPKTDETGMQEKEEAASQEAPATLDENSSSPAAANTHQANAQSVNESTAKNEKQITYAAAKTAQSPSEDRKAENSAPQNTDAYSESKALKSEKRNKDRSVKLSTDKKAPAAAAVYTSDADNDADLTQKEDSIHVPEEIIYTKTDKLPAYPGGNKALLKFIKHQFVFPSHYKDSAFTAVIYIQFIVNSAGEVRGPIITKGLGCCSDLEQEALRVVNAMPKWMPAELNGKSAATFYELPFTIENK